MKTYLGLGPSILVGTFFCLILINQAIAQPTPPPLPEPPGGSSTNYNGGYQTNIPDPPDGTGGEGEDENPVYFPAYNYTNGLWLEIITNDVEYATSYLNLHGTEAGKHYEIWTNPNLSSNVWSFETALFGATDVTPFATANGERTNLFYIATQSAEPVAIQFPSTYVTSNTLVGTITGGPVDQIAFLVNITNFTGATWTSFSTNPTVTIGSANGTYEVWFGYSQNGVTNWSATEIVLDSVPPILTITNPISSSTERPIVQIQGFCNEDIHTLFYSITNTVTNVEGEGFVMSQFFDTNLFRTTTNYFQIFDVKLVPGTNRVVVVAADHAGNISTTNLDFTFSVAGDTNAPVFAVDWPTNNAQIIGDHFTLRGHLDDPTAHVVGQMVTNGVTNIFTGEVDRSGKFWLNDLPISSGTNLITVIATDAGTNFSSQTISVHPSSLIITVSGMQSLPYGDYIYGTIGSTNYTLWVNGHPMTTYSATQWGGITELDQPTIQIRAYPSGHAPANGGGGSNSEPANNNPSDPNAEDMEFSQQIESRIKGKSFHQKSVERRWTAGGALDYMSEGRTDWVAGVGEYATSYTEYYIEPHVCTYTNLCPGPTIEGCSSSSGGWSQSGFCFLSDVGTQEVSSYHYRGVGVIPPYYNFGCGELQRRASSEIVLETAKDNSANETEGYVIHVDSRDLASVQAISDPGDFSDVPENMASLNPGEITIMGRELDSDGNVYVELQKNQKHPVAPVPKKKGNFAKVNVTVGPPKVVSMTWIRHPHFGNTPTLKNIQDHFNKGATNLLAKDDDGVLTDADAKKQNKWKSDDVPLYVKFKITQSPQTWGDVTTNINGTNITFHFAATNYWDIRIENDARDLLRYGNFANIRQVKSMSWDNKVVGGKTTLGLDKMIIDEESAPLTCIHEWGHMCDVDHRGEPSNASSGDPFEDAKAIMYFFPYSESVEINRDERQTIKNH